MASTIKYDGKILQFKTPKDAHDAMRLAFQHIEGLRKDLASLAADHAETANRLQGMQGGQAVTPLSVMTAFPAMPKAPALPVAPTTPQPTAPQRSPHRTAVPTITSVGPNTVAVIVAGATDRLFRLTLDFNNFAGGDTAVQIAFGAPYTDVPAVIPIQKGGQALVNLRPLAVTATGLSLTADNVLGPVLIEFDIIVVSPSADNFD